MKKERHLLALIVMISLFFMWGLITVLNDILIPHLKSLFSLDYFEVMLIQLCFFIAYGLISIPSGKIIEAIGYKKSVLIALITSSVGCWLFLPAASIPSYGFFLLAIFVLASGIVLLQVAANPYIALLGPASQSSSRLNLAQAFNSLGTTIGPLIGSYLILATFKTQNDVHGIHILYSAIAVLLLIIAVVIAFVRLPAVEVEHYEEFQENLAKEAAKKEGSAPKQHEEKIWDYPHLIWGAVAIFCYVGAEVSIGSFLVNFLMQPDILDISKLAAGQHVSLYWGGAMIGRFIGFALLLRIRPRKLLTFNVIFALLLVFLTIITKGTFAGYTIISVGLFNSIMFPTIFTLAIRGLGASTAQGSGILCTAIIGGAIIPVIQGIVADHITIHYAFLIPFCCYLYILYYARKGAIAKCKVH